MVVITSKYIKPLEVIDALVAEHRNFLDNCYKKSQLICFGPQIPRVGGLLIANVASVDEAPGNHEKRSLLYPWSR